MSQLFRIHVPARIDKKAAAWGLSAAFLGRVWKKVKTDLADDPASKLKAVIAPWGERLNMYTFNLSDPRKAAVTHTFMFHFKYTPDETGLIVVECGHLAKRYIG